MASYSYNGYWGGDVLIEGGGSTLVQGSKFMLDPSWDVSSDVRHFTFTDDDGNLSGDSSNDEHGNDPNQFVTVTDAAGQTLYSGQAYLENAATFHAPDGSTITLYVVEVNGQIVGVITSAPLQPGVTYHVDQINDVTTGPSYSSIGSTYYDPDNPNYIQGGQYNDSIEGGSGNDTITAGAGRDTIDGGTGDDTIYYGTGGATQSEGDLVHGGDGADLIDDASGTSNTYNDTLYGDAGNDTIWAGGGADYVDGGADNDQLYGEDGNDTIYGGTGNDTLWGGGGNDLLSGDAGNDSLLGDGGNDTLLGGTGSDTLRGGTGDDSMAGGADRDLFVMADGFGHDTIDGGSDAGTTEDDDSIDFAALSSGITVTFTGDEAGTATDGTNTVTFTDIESIEGTNYADSINASADSTGVYLGGDLGNDTITGGSGGDTIEGGGGADTVWAGAGDDWISGGAGNDTLQGASGNDTIWGGTGADELHGGDDADTFTLKSTDGSDTIYGGEGGTDWDVIQLSGAGAQVTWTGWESGTITYDGGTTYSYFWEVEQIDGTTYADRFDATASGTGVAVDAGAGNDTITGSAFGDTLDGGDGADQVSGGAGDDVIWGGIGLDTLSGGDGNDTIQGEGDSDLIDGGAGADSLDGGSGNDTIYGGDDGDTIVAGSGANLLYGDRGDDLIIGSTTNGGDTIYGGAGDDTIEAGIGPNLIAGGSGNDSISTGAGADTIAFADLDGADLITDFDMTVVNGATIDQLDVSDLHDGEGNPVNAWDVSVSDDGAGNAVLTFPGGESLTLIGVAPAQVQTAPQLYAMGIPCFVAGTRIATPRGPVAVERLSPGDLVNCRDGPPQPVMWRGHRRVSAAQMRADPRLCPIEFRAGALGNDRALRLSAQHCVFVPGGGDHRAGGSGAAPSLASSLAGPMAGGEAASGAGALVRAAHMAACGWGGARRMTGARGAEFHHLLLPRHGLILAEGAWVESFWPGRQALGALAPADRFALIRAIPALAGVIWGQGSPEAHYAARVRPVLPKRQIGRSACANWSRLLQQAPFSDGFATERMAP